ncbi:MAG: TIGR02996 domain-containing protein [Myxococcota bacterium]|nr:TIGR02996 domain-containing protein [Myxococcota bacterium]
MARFEKGSEVVETTYAAARYANEMRRLLRSGWTRVADLRCEVPLGGEPINATLEEALRSDPSDIGAALVYADWLQQQGHPRGALIAVQHRLSRNPRDVELIEAERVIVDEAGDALLSKPLLAHFTMMRGKHEMGLSKNLYEGGTVTFDHGFIREAVVVLKERGIDEDLFWELLRHPSARVLAKLVVRAERPRDIDLIAALITHGPRPPLRSLAFRVEQRGGVVDLSGLDVAYPLLEELELTIHNVRFGELDVPRLRRLALHGEYSDLGRILAAGPWPVLEGLEISGEPEGYQLAFEHPQFPKLRSLSIHRTHRADPPRDGLLICRLIVRSPIAAQLERLHLPGVRLSLEAITMLVENRARFERLATLKIETSGRSFDLERLREAGYPL